jgi:putative transposase
VSRYRLQPTPEQETALLRHCSDARYVWNLCVEQENEYRSGRGHTPGLAERCQQLTDTGTENPWLAEGSAIVQQQAIRDHANVMQAFFNGTHGKPGWRKAGKREGFRITGKRGRAWDVRRLNRKTGEVFIAKVGWVRFRWPRAVPEGVKSFRVTRDRSGRWHIAFAHIPDPVPAPGNGQVAGVDRGVAVSAALSTGEKLHCPRLSPREEERLLRLERKLARARRGSNRRAKVKNQVARMKARETDRCKDWTEKLSTDLAQRFDLIRIEKLPVQKMTRSATGTTDKPGKNVKAKARLNRGVSRSAWGKLATRLEDKAPGRVEKVPPAYTSQRCSACGHTAAESRESQALFRCVACGFTCNADVNAAINIAAGQVVNARGGDRATGPANREAQPALT